MEKNKRYILCLCITFFYLAGCSGKPACRNANLIFEKLTPGTKEYKSELAKQIQKTGSDNLRYWFVHYAKKGTSEYILVQVRGADLCAMAEIQVNNWGKISNMRREPGGYSGAELKGLEIDTEDDSSGTNFIFRNVDRIMD